MFDLKNIQRYLLTMGHPYKMSQFKEVYEQLAAKYNISVDRVYDLAHGKRAYTIVEDMVVGELHDKHILS